MLAHIRWRRLCNAEGVDPAAVPRADFRDVESLFSDLYCAELAGYCIDHGPNGLVVIDTYGAMLAADIDNNSPQFANWLRQLGKISRSSDVTLVVLVHHNKSAKGGGLEGIAGNYQGAGAMQGVVALERTGTEVEDPILVRCTRAPERGFAPYQIKWEDVAAPGSRDTPGAKARHGMWGLRATRVDSFAEPLAVSHAEAERKRVKIARGIVASLAQTPGQKKTAVVKSTRGGSEKEIGRVFNDLIDLGVLVEVKVAERIIGGTVEPVIGYHVGALDPAGIESRMKAGLVD